MKTTTRGFLALLGLSFAVLRAGASVTISPSSGTYCLYDYVDLTASEASPTPPSSECCGDHGAQGSWSLTSSSWTWSGDASGNGNNTAVLDTTSGSGTKTVTATVTRTWTCSATGNKETTTASAQVSFTVPHLTISPGYGTLCVGEGEQLEVNGGSGNYTWRSSDPAVATVDSSGWLTASGAGAVTITATDTETGCVSDICQISVIALDTSGPSTACFPNDTQLTVNGNQGTYRWTSSDENIATVVGSGSTGTVTPLGNGSVTITATDGSGCSASHEMSISWVVAYAQQTSVAKGENLQVQATGGTGAPYTWQSANATKASVNSQGVVTGLQPSDSLNDVPIIARDGNSCEGQLNITVFEVQLDVQNQLLTLKHDRECNLEVRLQPDGIQASQWRIEIERTSEGVWHTLASQQSLTPWYANIAGAFRLRGSAFVTGKRYYSPYTSVIVKFPTYAQIVGDTTVQSRTDAEWANTKNDCTENPNQRRERGFYVRLNTTDNQYEFTSTVLGSFVGPTDGGWIMLGPKPNDNPTQPLPNASGATYTVAFFHTHTPTTYRALYYPKDYTREVGPSDPDETYGAELGLPGIVYDYSSSEAYPGAIPMGWPKDSAAKRYPIGQPDSRRSTP